MKLSITFTILLFTFYFLLSAVIFAQAAPEFLVSWRAVGYVPPDYQGKILPNKNSRVEMGFDLIAQNKIADLSRYNISWFLDFEVNNSICKNWDIVFCYDFLLRDVSCFYPHINFSHCLYYWDDPI